MTQEDVLFSYADPSTPLLRRKVIRGIEIATGQRTLEKMYRHYQTQPRPGESFWAAAIRYLRLDIRHDRDALAAVPNVGPVMVVANHPFGVLDGIILSYLVEQVRMDFLVLTNAVLLKAPEVRRSVLGIDFGGTQEARETNLRSRAAARAHLERGGCLVVFPAGGVSTAPDRFGRRPAVDASWQPFTAQLIQRAKATVVPVRFFGQNSRAFQVASHLSQTLRLSLIFHEVRRRIATAIPVAIGEPIRFEAMAASGNRAALLTMLRERTYSLAEPAAAAKG